MIKGGDSSEVFPYYKDELPTRDVSFDVIPSINDLEALADHRIYYPLRDALLKASKSSSNNNKPAQRMIKVEETLNVWCKDHGVRLSVREREQMKQFGQYLLNKKTMKNKKSVLIKNEREIEIMRENAKIHKEVFEEIKKMVKP